jgi:hypothetical protein
MRVRHFSGYIQLCFPLILLFLFSILQGCSRKTEELPVMPPATHPLAREYIGFGVVNISFTHVFNETGPAGVSQGYLRRGTVVRIIERRQLVNRDSAESWVLAEAPLPVKGWLLESSLDIYDSESRANTASKAMNQ